MLNQSEENTRVLLGIIEQRRQHLSTAIGALNGLAITIIIGIWSFFLKSFLDARLLISSPSGSAQPVPFVFSYIVAAAGLSTLVVALWRWYTKYIDGQIADTYPEILRYEQALGVVDAGVTKYIAKNKVIGKYLSELSQGQQICLIKRMVADKRIGMRGHGWIDLGAFLLIILFLAMISFDIYEQYRNRLLGILVPTGIVTNLDPVLALRWVGYFLMGLGIVILVVVFLRFQRNPSKDYVAGLVKEIKAQKTKIQSKQGRRN